MKKQWKRLLIAALSSSSVFAATWFWYTSTQNQLHSHGNEKPLAYVGKVVDDIQRRPSSRLLWQLINTGEPLYNGEAIRTSERGEVRIQFADSDRYLDLEPESLIVIKKSEGEIALDLMEGSLFVNANTGNTTSAGAGLVLNSAQGKVDLSNVSASLSKGQGNAVDVQVLEGKASIKGQDGKNKELQTQSEVRILTPVPQKAISMDADAMEAIPFQWRGFPTNTEVTLWVGPSRKNLSPFTKALFNQSNLKASLSFGRHYWKLVASNKAGEKLAETPVYRTDIVARYAPTVVFPTADLTIPVKSTPYDLTFKWEKGEDTKQITLEIWKDADLKNKVAAQSFKKEDSYALPKLQAGTYYWRMSSLYNDSDKPLLGKLQKFTIVPEGIPAPKEIPPVQVQFTLPAAQWTQYYVAEPSVGLTWAADNSENIKSWRVQVQAEGDTTAAPKSVEVQDTKLSTPVSKPGRYIASIEALDKTGKVLGSTSSQVLTVAPLPLLQAPTFVPADGMLQASADGRTQLSWTPVQGAKEYWLSIKKDGKELKRSRYVNNSTALRNLLPGQYEVSIFAIDMHGRESMQGPERKLKVPDKSDLAAPTLKKIKVN